MAYLERATKALISDAAVGSMLMAQQLSRGIFDFCG
jgi:hypothetical protein